MAKKSNKSKEDEFKTNEATRIDNFGHPLVCIKKKVARKYYPPEVSAMKLLIELTSKDDESSISALAKRIQKMTNEELIAFRNELLKKGD